MKKTVALHNLGCKVNAYELEAIQQLLEDRGYEIVPFAPGADVYIINTCTVTNIADRKSRQMLHKAKKMNPDAVVVACGCYVQAAGEKLEEDTAIDLIIGNNKKKDLVDILENFLAEREDGGKPSDAECKSFLVDMTHNREYETLSISKTAEHTRAFLKVQDGCNQFCTYCIIPKLRGNYRSFPMEKLVKEAEELAAQGVKELILVAQETTLYGTDIYGKKSLHLLLKELCKIKGIRWIRVQYCYPEEIYDELIQTMKEEPKVCNYLDLPIQHASDRILKRMGRRTSQADLRAIIGKLRQEIPDICLRTTLISGFPGETEEDHEELMNFVDEMEFDRLGVFTYSAEEDTPAATMPDQIPEELKEERRDEIMELQQEISFEKAEEMVGKSLWCMVEGKVADEYAYVARTYKDAPGVDGYLFIQTIEELMSGDFVKVKVTGADDYDLIGEIDDESAE